MPKRPELRSHIHQTYSFDILALSETWLRDNISDRLLNSLFRRDRPDNLNLPQGKGGVAKLVRDSLRSELLASWVTDINDSNLEIVWVHVHVQCISVEDDLCLSRPRTEFVTTARQKSTDFDDLEQ